MKKKLQRYQKDAMMIGATGMGLAFGSQAITEAGGNAAPLTKMSGALPKVAGIASAGLLLDSVRMLDKSSRRKKRY